MIITLYVILEGSADDSNPDMIPCNKLYELELQILDEPWKRFMSEVHIFLLPAQSFRLLSVFRRRSFSSLKLNLLYLFKMHLFFFQLLFLWVPVHHVFWLSKNLLPACLYPFLWIKAQGIAPLMRYKHAHTFETNLPRTRTRSEERRVGKECSS